MRCRKVAAQSIILFLKVIRFFTRDKGDHLSNFFFKFTCLKKYKTRNTNDINDITLS